MADARQQAGGGPETQRDSLHEYQQAQYERIATPTMSKPLESYPEFMQRRAQEAAVRADMAREAKVAAQDLAGAYATRQALDGPHGAMLGQALGGGIAQMLRAPGKMFSRSDILAILRARLAAGTGIGPDGLHSAAVFEIQYLIKTFENLE